MKMGFLLILLFSVKSFAQKALSAEEIISSILKKDNGEVFRMYETRKFTASVFVFLLPDCPACENYALTLNTLSLKFKANGIQFYGVFPPFVKAEEIKKYKNDYQVKFPLLVDNNKELLHAFDAHIAPEAFIVSETTWLLYRGRIDDWFYAVGKKKLVISKHELEDALNDIVAHKKVAVSKTQPVGCIID